MDRRAWILLLNKLSCEASPNDDHGDDSTPSHQLDSETESCCSAVSNCPNLRRESLLPYLHRPSFLIFPMALGYCKRSIWRKGLGIGREMLGIPRGRISRERDTNIGGKDHPNAVSCSPLGTSLSFPPSSPVE